MADLAAGDSPDFAPVCDAVEHIGTTAGDALSLIRPAFFLAKTAQEKFPEKTTVAGLAAQDIKRLLERIEGALELHLAFNASKSDSTAIDPFAFRDVCHLAQAAWFTTGMLQGLVPDLVPLRDQLAAQSQRLAADFAQRRAGSNFPFFTYAFWGLAFGTLGWWGWKRLNKRLT